MIELILVLLFLVGGGIIILLALGLALFILVEVFDYGSRPF